MICRSDISEQHNTAYRRHKNLLYVVFFILLFNIPNLHCQTDSVKHLPKETISYATETLLESNTFNSVYIALPLFCQSITYRNYGVHLRDMRIRYFNNFSYDYDTYLQFVPFGLAYALKGFGLQSESSWTQMITASALAFTVGYGLTSLLKNNIEERRPEYAAYKSFPSGHTAIAFIGASVLSKEYKNKYPWISVGGYMLAAATGISRIANNRHWLHDVFAGAGLGISATELAYSLTGILFNKQYSGNFSADYNDTHNEHPNFANLSVTYNINFFNNPQQLNNSTSYSVRNGIGACVEAAYFPWKHLGLDVKTKIDAYIVDNQNIWWPEDSVMFIKSFEIGPVFAYPVISRIYTGIRCGIGMNHVDGNQLQDDVPLKSQNNMQYSFGVFANIWTDRHTYLRLFADYNYTCLTIEDVKQKFPVAAFGCCFGLHF